MLRAEPRPVLNPVIVRICLLLSKETSLIVAPLRVALLGEPVTPSTVTVCSGGITVYPLEKN